MAKKRVKKLFIVVMIFLPVQYVVVGIVGFTDAEPWPAFVFPGFKSVPVFEGAFETEQKVFKLVPVSNQEGAISQTPAEIFPEIPVSQLSGFIRQNFSEGRDFISISDEGKKWLLNRAEGSSGVEIREISLRTLKEYRRFVDGSMILDSTAVIQEQIIVEVE